MIIAFHSDSLNNDYSCSLIWDHLNSLQSQANEYISVEKNLGIHGYWTLSVNELCKQLNMTSWMSYLSSNACSWSTVLMNWINFGKAHGRVSAFLKALLIQFATSYLCKLGFSTLTAVQKHQETNWLLANELKMCITCIRKMKTDFYKSVQAKQANISY